MTINNPEKIHFIREVHGEDRYICNQACGITPEKSTREKNKVTCKNCLRRLEAENEF